MIKMSEDSKSDEDSDDQPMCRRRSLSSSLSILRLADDRQEGIREDAARAVAKSTEGATAC